MFPGCCRDAPGTVPECPGVRWHGTALPVLREIGVQGILPSGTGAGDGDKGRAAPSALSRCPLVEPGAAPCSNRVRRRAGCVTLGFYTSIVPGWKSLVAPSEGAGLPGGARGCPGATGCLSPLRPSLSPQPRGAARLARERNLTQRPGQAERRAKWKAKKGEEEKTFH